MKYLILNVLDRIDQALRDHLCKHGHLCIERSPSSGYLEYWCRVCRRDLPEKTA